MRYFILAILLVIGGEAWATNYCSQAVGCWLFTDGSGTGLYDSSGYGNNGSLYNTPSWDTTDVNFGTSGSAPNSVVFNGSNQYATFGSYSSIDNMFSSNSSISTWMKFDGTSAAASQWLLTKGAGSVGFLMFYRTATHASPNSITVRIYRATTNAETAAASSSVSSGTWEHWSATWNITNEIKLYKNAVLITSFYGTPTVGSGSFLDDSAYSLRFGSSELPSNFFDGNLSETAIFNSPLSSTDISIIYNYGLQGQTTATTGPSIIRNSIIRNSIIGRR
jgi:hypothetical protein